MKAAEEATWSRASGCPTHFFSLVVVRHPKTKLFLAVEESRNRGWWLPGGFCEPGDNHEKTALKETMEEAGLEVTLKGILHIECSMRLQGARQRVIYYAEPTDPSKPPKSIPDDESKSARWVSVAELEAMAALPPPAGLRGDELLVWAHYLEKKGPIYPLGVLAMTEGEPPKRPSKEELKRVY
jgi:8-oxo-dGTP diphosphatase